MHYQVLINDTVKNHLLQAGPTRRRQLRKAFEFLESGLWEGGLRVKKLRGNPEKTILEGRLNGGDRLLFTVGERSPEKRRDIHIWGVVQHDDVDRAARAILPENAPFLAFEPYSSTEKSDLDLDELEPECLTQEYVHAPSRLESGQQRWFVLDERQWRRLALYEKGDFEIFLYLTPEQEELLQSSPPLLVSGTAGSGKSTLLIYYLLQPGLEGKSKLFLTYNRHLKDFSERLYAALCTTAEKRDPNPPLFLTFSDLCRRLVPDVERAFPPPSEVDVFTFQRLFSRYTRAEKLDYALIWEEIRSIIKGAKPQVNLDRFNSTVLSLRKHGAQEGLLQELREELLSLRLLSAGRPVERMFQKQFGLALDRAALQLEELAEKNLDRLLRALETAQHRLRVRDIDSHAPLMSLAEYEQLGRKRAPNFPHNREELHAIALWYQGQLAQLGLWDEIDLSRAALQALEHPNHPVQRFDLVACDEIQDLTDVQLSLLFRQARDPRRLLLAGDPKQIVNPSGFRWEEVRQMFYERKLEVPRVQHLTLNFRCSGSIVLLANSLLRLKQRLLGVQSEEKLDQWKYQGRLPTLIVGLSPEALLEQVQITGADRIILTRSEAERDFLKEQLETELVMTIREAKGLEFSTVLLWRFASGVEEVWSKILAEQTQRLHDALIRHEFNLLYVGLTRARENLLLYDGSQVSPIWQSEELRDYVLRTDDLHYLTRCWHAPSSRAEWKRQGDYYLERHHYRAAAECYRNAEETKSMHRALALAAEKSGQFLQAAEQWVRLEEWRPAAAAFERACEFERARQLWLKMEDAEAATRCHLSSLEARGAFAELAGHWEHQGDTHKAVHYWQKAHRPERVASLLERQKKWSAAARAFEQAGDWDRAALLYEKSRLHAEAARAYERAGRWEEAVARWRKLKRDQDVLRCLGKLGDPVRMAAFYEDKRQWEKALHIYQQAWNEELQARFERELQMKGRGPVRRHAQRALRLHLLERFQAAAEAWEKSKEYLSAAACYSKAGCLPDSARCLEKAGDWMPALLLYVQIPQERERRFINLRRCVRRALAQGGARLQKELETCAFRLEVEENFEAASQIYEALGYRWEAGVAAALAADLPRSLRLCGRFRSYDEIRLRFTRFGRYREGAELLRAHFRNTFYFFDKPEIAPVYERLLADWLHTGSSPDLIEEVAGHVREGAFDFSTSFVWRVLEPAGYYDTLYTSQRYKSDRRNKADKQLVLEAQSMESRRQWAQAGLRYLLVEDREAAARCWANVPVEERNRLCKEQAGFWREVFDYLEKENRCLEAARLAARHQHPDLARHMIDRSGDLREGARIFEMNGFFENAYELYRQCGLPRKAAHMLERLKRYEEAAQQWKTLGDQARRLKCLQKTARQEQTQGRLFK